MVALFVQPAVEGFDVVICPPRIAMYRNFFRTNCGEPVPHVIKKLLNFVSDFPIVFGFPNQ